MQDLGQLWAFCSRRFCLASPLHGPFHWPRVEWYGLSIARRNGADPDFVRLFAVLHDACRESESADVEHGQRAARLAEQLRGELFRLDDPLFSKLLVCCTEHDRGKTSTDVEIGTCWDADRLDLTRCGVAPDLRYLSTDVARGWILANAPRHVADLSGLPAISIA